MTKKQLLERLASVPDDTEILIGLDVYEGKPLDTVELDAIYHPVWDWRGDLYRPESTARQSGMDEDDWQELLKQPRVVVLWPAD